ncbi:2-C-methyl-D-erythritol 4-phosphate cytidylyltransferase [Candidatus Pandoraea novymonadis]|uniref:2-C-methyl-D-erythritol 4-phosphate cytidylyltransferase n=1 Tax=Candidatus Pandoraea novymonadis TaxID=1808959 RepID=A0ABX5FFC0_9BURK|nr:2-C-methyl-D-erythritol 4-phosphate cytidylyltransferase [Candidatus Pandoraea novymonadis]PSB92173.1 2-C-methyl-D-erythritol 4-phosphate cytidylyltransferase [Candidatus Pandoraea novymonadis]
MTDQIFALIPCAGAGLRAGLSIPKQYCSVAGRAILHHALAAFDACPEFSRTLVVLAPDDNHFDAHYFRNLRFSVRRCGGRSRQESVLNGLHALSDFGAHDSDWVLVHDAARPGITTTLIRKLISTLYNDPVGGLLALPIVDTLKSGVFSVGSSGLAEVRKTETRDGLWQAQTPQMFRLGMLCLALEKALDSCIEITDESSAIERLGHHPKLVCGSLRNFKVTYPEDFFLAETLLSTPCEFD